MQLAIIRLGWNLLADTDVDDNIIVIFVQLGFSMKLTHLTQFNTDLFRVMCRFIYTMVWRDAILIKD